jgi:hypothetical protein
MQVAELIDKPKTIFEESYNGDLDYTSYRLILERFYQNMVDHIINGGSYDMGWAGKIYVRKVLRSKHTAKPLNKSINWGVTSTLMKRGHKMLVFYDDEFFLQIYWTKGSDKYKHPALKYYSFQPTANSSSSYLRSRPHYCKLGFRGRMSQYNRENVFAHYRYETWHRPKGAKRFIKCI